jgi:hypothetical protein
MEVYGRINGSNGIVIYVKKYVRFLEGIVIYLEGISMYIRAVLVNIGLEICTY